MSGGAPAGPAAPLVEIFGSIQGEGRHVGAGMAFVRVARCPVRCTYCDTPHSYDVAEHAIVHGRTGEEREPNPVSAARAAALVEQLGAPWSGCVSVTGGEPLLYPEFVAALAAAVAPATVHLETAALHPDALRACIGGLHHVSADYKLPGTLERGDYAARHVECVRIAAESGCAVDVKMVITSAVTDAAVDAALDRLSPFRRQVLLVFQPVTPFGAETATVPTARLLALAERAAARGLSPRVLPQVHRTLGCN